MGESNEQTKRDAWRAARGSAAVLACLVIASAAAGAEPGSPSAASKLVVNVNTANLEELQHLPGVGETRARAILAEREARGGFKSVDELVEVKGIGSSSLERIRPHARTSGKTKLPMPRP